MIQLTTEERIIKQKIQLQKQSPFFAHLVMNMSIKEDKSGRLPVPTMGVDSKGNAIYNAKFIDDLTDAQLKGVLCHETMHVALQHLIRLGKKQTLLWNVATDMAINWIITQEGYQLPEKGIIPDHSGRVIIETEEGKKYFDVDGKTAEQLYEELIKELPECKCDCHDGAGKCGSGTSDPNGTGGQCCPCQGGFDNHFYGDDMSDAEQEALSKEWRGKLVDAATAAKARGKLPGSIERLVDELLNPKLDWKTILHQFITKDIPYDYTMRKPGRRSHSLGIYLPDVLKENLNITCTVDTSGSISKEEYQVFATELMAMASSFQQIDMDIVYWDTRVVGEIKVQRGKEKDIIEKAHLGGGGTSMSCLGEHFKDKQPPKIMIHLTDGYIETDPFLPSCKHLFVIPEHGTDSRLKERGMVARLD